MPRRAAAPQPSERRSSEWAHGRLRGAIIAGELAPGTIVSQSGLATEFGVSRTPLREATLRLQQEGLLVGEPNRRLRVAGASPEDLDQLYAIRIATESLALTIGVERMSGSHVEQVAAALAAMETAVLDGRLDLVDPPHREFHRLLVTAAGDRFEREATVLWDHTVRYRALYVSAEGADLGSLLIEAQAEHSAILAAVRDGDGALAGARLAGHYARTARAVFDSIDSPTAAEAIEVALATAESRVR